MNETIVYCVKCGDSGDIDNTRVYRGLRLCLTCYTKQAQAKDCNSCNMEKGRCFGACIEIPNEGVDIEAEPEDVMYEGLCKGAIACLKHGVEPTCNGCKLGSEEECGDTL